MREAFEINPAVAETDLDSFNSIFNSNDPDLVRRTIQSLTLCCGEEREKVVLALRSLTESSLEEWRRYYAIEGLSSMGDQDSILLLAEIWSDRSRTNWIRSSAGHALREIDKDQREKMDCQQQNGQETFETRAAVVALNQIFGSSPDPRGDKPE